MSHQGIAHWLEIVCATKKIIDRKNEDHLAYGPYHEPTKHCGAQLYKDGRNLTTNIVEQILNNALLKNKNEGGDSVY